MLGFMLVYLNAMLMCLWMYMLKYSVAYGLFSFYEKYMRVLGFIFYLNSEQRNVDAHTKMSTSMGLTHGFPQGAVLRSLLFFPCSRLEVTAQADWW